MCTVVTDESSSSSSSTLGFAGVVLLAAAGVLAALGPTAIIAAGAAAAAVLILAFRPTRRAAWWVTTHAIVPTVVAMTVLAALWLAGKPFTGRAAGRRKESGATWLRSGAKVLASTRTSAHWYAWAGWQRTAVRAGSVAVATAAWLAPLATAAVAVSALLIAVARIITMRIAARRDDDKVLRVRAVVGPPTRPAVGSVFADEDFPKDLADAVEGELLTPAGIR